MLGQVFTPPPVARWMTAWACAHAPRTILEPAVGEGVFLDAIETIARGHSDWRPCVRTYEVDDVLRRRLSMAMRAIETELVGGDFIRCEAAMQFDACVANPPYVRHHALAYDDAVYLGFDRQVGERISRMTNLYGLFLLRIWDRLAEGGRAAVILPSEWLNADFGKPLKRYLLRENAIDGLVLFDDATLIFDAALTTAAIVLLRRNRGPREPIRVAVVKDSEALLRLDVSRMRGVDRGSLDPARKWTNTLNDAHGGTADSSSVATLADVASCMRGIATGANDYFTLTETQRVAAKIDARDVLPCITRAAHASGDTFDRAAFESLVQSDRKAWLLNPREPLRNSIERYLDAGRSRGIDRRYLPSHRPVWYRPEQRPAAPIWSPVFVRGRFRFVHNRAGASNLTAFHGVYPYRKDAAEIDALLEYLWSDAAQRAIGAQSRVYGGGLRKLEPRDVLAIPIPESLRRALCDQ